MANVLDRNFEFATNGTVTAAGLHNLIDETNIYAGLISTQEESTSVGTGDLLLIANSSSISSPQITANRTTVYNLFDDALTSGTYANAQLSGSLTYGTATGNRTISTSAVITNATTGTTTGTLGNFTSAAITSGTITTGLIPTLTAGTTTGTAGIFTSGTIGNFTTTLTGDLTISQGTATLSTTGATAGTYGTTGGVIPSIAVDSKGRITSIGTALGGKILQVVESTYSTSVVVASTSFSDTGLSSSITPTYSSSRILVLAQQNSSCSRVSATMGAQLKIVRTIGTIPTDIYSQGTSALDILISVGASTSVKLVANVFVECVDSPSTTSQCTYKLQGAATTIANSGQVEFQNESSISKLILMEVAA